MIHVPIIYHIMIWLDLFVRLLEKNANGIKLGTQKAAKNSDSFGAFLRFACAMVKSRYIADGHPTFNRNPYIYNGYINPYYWVDDHPLLYGNDGSLDPGTNGGE